VAVRDDGTGFAVAPAAGQASNHLGLQSMRERAAILGGELKIISGSGQGTTVVVVLPRPADDSEPMRQAG
jgi:signal transduction histidine kinase